MDLIKLAETFIANIQVLRRVAIPIEVYESMKLKEGERVRVSIERLDSSVQENAKEEKQ